MVWTRFKQLACAMIAAAMIVPRGAIAQDFDSYPAAPQVVQCKDGKNCKTPEGDDVILRRPAWLDADPRSDAALLLDGDDSVLHQRLARLAREEWPRDQPRQDRFVAAQYDRAERRLLDHALGLDQGFGNSNYVSGGSNPVLISAVPFIAELRYRDSLTTREVPGFAQTRIFGLRWEARHRCGATLIARDWVVTAAHCIQADKVSTGLAVQLGVTDISTNNGQSVNIDYAVVHAGYAPGNKYYHDIAMLHLVPYSLRESAKKVAVVPIFSGTVGRDRTVNAAGWGRINDDPRAEVNATALLRRADFQVLGNDECAARPSYGLIDVTDAAGRKSKVARVHGGVMCIYGKRRKTCDGDSGGPLFFDQPDARGRMAQQLVGIVSWNKLGCHVDSDDSPGVYTRIAPYLDWIKRVKLLPAPGSGQTVTLP